MRRAANVDRNQPDIVKSLRSAGVQVECTHAVGGGFPDLVCGYRGRSVLLEVKSDNDQLNAMQRDWHAKWPGQVAVVRTFDEAMSAVLEACK